MTGALGSLTGPRVEVSRRGPRPKKLADPRAMADKIIGLLKAAELSPAGVHEVIQLLPGSLRSTARAVSRVDPVMPTAGGDDDE